jgi:ribosomal protein L40E
MPGMGNPGGMPGGVPPRAGSPQNPIGGGPPGIVSAQEAFGEVGTLPTPDPYMMSQRTVQQNNGNGCSSCGAGLRPNAKFCTKCGSKA